MTDFIKIKDERITVSSIKRYKPEGEKNINLYFNTSRTKPEYTTIVFNSKIERNRELHKIDLLFPTTLL